MKTGIVKNKPGKNSDPKPPTAQKYRKIVEKRQKNLVENLQKYRKIVQKCRKT